MCITLRLPCRIRSLWCKTRFERRSTHVVARLAASRSHGAYWHVRSARTSSVGATTAVGTAAIVRLDLSFGIVRFDLAVPVHSPQTTQNTTQSDAETNKTLHRTVHKYTHSDIYTIRTHTSPTPLVHPSKCIFGEKTRVGFGRTYVSLPFVCTVVCALSSRHGLM